MALLGSLLPFDTRGYTSGLLWFRIGKRHQTANTDGHPINYLLALHIIICNLMNLSNSWVSKARDKNSLSHERSRFLAKPERPNCWRVLIACHPSAWFVYDWIAPYQMIAGNDYHQRPNMFSSQVVFIAATCVNIFHEVSPKIPCFLCQQDFYLLWYCFACRLHIIHANFCSWKWLWGGYLRAFATHVWQCIILLGGGRGVL